MYLSEIKNRLDKIIATEMDKIAQIAQKAARSIANGGAVHLSLIHNSEPTRPY